jgi:hypothetical protein
VAERRICKESSPDPLTNTPAFWFGIHVIAVPEVFDHFPNMFWRLDFYKQERSKILMNKAECIAQLTSSFRLRARTLVTNFCLEISQRGDKK